MFHVFGLVFALVTGDQHPSMLTVDQWRADLQFLATQMPLKHKNLYHTMTPQAFHQAVDQLNADIPHLNDDEIVVRIATIAAMPEDSHTDILSPPPGLFFPLRLRHYDDGVYVESAPPKYAAVVGGKLERIGDTNADDVYNDVGPLLSRDTGNNGVLTWLGPVLMMSGHVLHGLDIEPSADRATVVIRKGGKDLTLDLTPEASIETLTGHAPIAGWVDARGTGAPPLWLMHPDRIFWSTYLPTQRLFYIQFNEVHNTKGETIEHFFTSAFAQAAKLPVDKMVLDIRLNHGGNNTLERPIIIGMIRNASIDRPGHLFVIISSWTYSAAQNLTNRIEAYTDAVFVGQPTGEHVNSYGDPIVFTLLNSRIQVGMSSLWWQDVSERDKRIETDPEIAAVPTIADYEANRDPAMVAIVAYKPEASLEDQVLKGGLAAYRAWAADPIHRYVVGAMEKRINRLGYTLITNHQWQQAIAVFVVNTRANPNSANAADSLGEAYADAGDKADAIASYRRALQIDPTFQSSIDALTRLSATPGG